MDRHNDCLEIYARGDAGRIELTDDGAVPDDLEMSGVNLNTPHRNSLLDGILKGFGVQRGSDNQLMVITTPNGFAQKKNDLLQAMLAVDDLLLISSPKVRNFFIEDVETWLEDSDIRHVRQSHFAGKSGYLHAFNFVIPKSNKNPERVLHTLNSATKDKAETLIWRWTDTASTRPDGSLLYVLSNDHYKEPSADVLDVMRHYAIHPVLWSERESIVERLAS